MLAPEPVAIFGRILLSLILLVAVWGKLRHRKVFCSDLQTSFGLSGYQAFFSYLVLLLAEIIICGALLLGGDWVVTGLWSALLLFSVMTLLMAVMLIQNRVFKCNCFGESHHNVNAGDLLRNLFLISITAISLLSANPYQFTMTEHWLLFLAAIPVSLVIISFNDIYLVLKWQERKL